MHADGRRCHPPLSVSCSLPLPRSLSKSTISVTPPLAQKEERVVQRVCPRRDAEAAQQIQRAERHSTDRSERERRYAIGIAERADVVEGGKDQRTNYRCEHAGTFGAESEE